MRRRRVVLYDDDPAVLELLTVFFADLGYDVIGLSEPATCPVYQDAGDCIQDRPCADLMIADLRPPRIPPLELFTRQQSRGCKLDPRNKAILAGSFDHADVPAIARLGCAAFVKPCRLSRLAEWAAACEQHMELDQPLGIPRREPRSACAFRAVFSVEQEHGVHAGVVTNVSPSGLCVRTERQLAERQVLELHTPFALPTNRVQVRWTRSDDDGSLSGTSCC
jgi:CheY-like chemotaxis protein